MPTSPRTGRAPRRDDAELLGALYDEYGASLHSYARGFLGDAARAEDVVQEVLLRAWRNPDKVDPASGSPRGWLFTVARNVLTDVWRAERARPREVDDERALLERAVEDPVERLVETWTVEAAMERLSADHRAVLVEIHIRGCSVAEAARRLGIPEGTVKSRTFKGLRRLREILREMGAIA